MTAIVTINGRGLPVRGDDIDTDRIMPARFLRATTFDGLERHLFEDDRAGAPSHPFSDPRYAGASILVVNRNFGCGSSREHAPQGLVRWGIRAVVGASFSEIFQGNASMLGLPCFVVHADAAERLQTTIERTPVLEITADVAGGTIVAGADRIATSLPPAIRDAFLTDRWNPTSMLLERFDEVRAVANRLPYPAFR